MGDYTFSVSSNVRALSPVEFQPNLGSSALFFSPDQIGHTMQDDLLLEKNAGKQAQSQLSSSSVETTSNGEQALEEYPTRKGKGDDSVVNSCPEKSENPDAVTSPLQLGFSTEPSVITTSGPSFWSTVATDDAFIQGIPTVNGTLAFPSFPGSPMFGANVGHPQRRAITGAHNFAPQTRGPPPQGPPLFKAYSSWSSPQQPSWSTPPWSAGASQKRSVPSLGPISPGKESPKFRRSTSLPVGKPPLDDDGFQVPSGPLDTLRFPLEQQLLDMVRQGDQDPHYCKGRPAGEHAPRVTGASCAVSCRRPRGRPRQAGQSPGLLAEERQVALLPRRGRAGAGGAAVLAQGRRRGGRGRALLAQGLRGRPAAGHRRGGDHGVVPPLRPARGRLAAQGREQVVLPAQGLRLPAVPRRVLGAGAHGRLHPGGGQAVPVRQQPHHQGQARADPALAAGRRRLRAGRLAAARPTQDRLRGRRAQAAQGRRAGHDHGPAVRRRLLRGHRHGPGAQVPQGRRPRGLLQPAELHRRHQRPLRPAAARGHREAGGSEAVRAGRPDVRRVPGGPVRRQVRALLLRQRDLPAVLLRALLGHDPLAARPRVPQAAGEGGRRPAPGSTLPLVLGGGCDSSPRDNQRLVGPLPVTDRWTYPF
ncbi:unnamed protein product [Ixodes hexagonus]